MLPLLLNMHNTVCFQQAVWGCRYASKSKFHIVQLRVSLLSHWKLHFNLLRNNCKIRKKENSRHICAGWENTQQIVSLWNDLWHTGSPSGHCNFHASGFSSSVLMQKHVDAEWGLSEARWARAQLLCSQHEGLYITHALDKSALLCPNKDTQSQPHPAQNETLLALHSTQFTVNCALQTLVNHLCGIHLIFLPKMYMNINVHAIKPATKIPQTDAASSVVNTARWSNPLIWLCAGFSLISLHCLHQLWKASEGSRWTITIIKHRKSPRVYKYRPLQSFTKHHSNHQHYFWM